MYKVSRGVNDIGHVIYEIEKPHNQKVHNIGHCHKGDKELIDVWFMYENRFGLTKSYFLTIDPKMNKKYDITYNEFFECVQIHLIPITRYSRRYKFSLVPETDYDIDVREYYDRRSNYYFAAMLNGKYLVQNNGKPGLIESVEIPSNIICNPNKRDLMNETYKNLLAAGIYGKECDIIKIQKLGDKIILVEGD